LKRSVNIYNQLTFVILILNINITSLVYDCENCIAERIQTGDTESRAQSTNNGRIGRV
jgi:hypothetical protein